MTDDNVQSREQDGILKADRILLGISAAMIPASLVLLGLPKVIAGPAKWLLNAALILNIPTLAALLWHSVRWPVRWQLMKGRNLAAVQELSKDMIHILEEVAVPAMHAETYGVAGENVIEGPDGKKYLRMSKEEADKRSREALARSLDPDNPIVSNTLTAHARKIHEAQRSALVGALDERSASFKRAIDIFARYTRHWWFLAMIMSALMSVLCLLNK